MVRAPTKTCPNLHRILTDAPTDLVARFLKSRHFDRLGWLEKYSFRPDTSDGRDHAAKMLAVEAKANLASLETEATRIATIAGNRGQFALEGLVRDAEDEDLSRAFVAQGDELARSLWAWLDYTRLFEAAENVLHLRMYRRYDKHYQTFAAAPVDADDRDEGSSVLSEFLKEIEKGLNRGAGCNIDRYDIPAEGDEPEAEMYVIRHPNLPTAAREIDESGVVSRFYFRPPGEAMVVYVPSTGRLHVRADTRTTRHLVWKAFVSKALMQEISHQPVDFQAYDLSRFFRGFELPLPQDREAMVKQASVIRLEASIGELSNRISVATTINEGVGGVIKGQQGLEEVFANAVAIRFVEIAVRYRRVARTEDQVLDFTISDGNTSSLMSLDDPFEQALGHRLLREWGLMAEGRAPAAADFKVVLPAILALWDADAEWVNGAWLADRNLDVKYLIHLGFLVAQGWEDSDLIDEEDGVGMQEAKFDTGPDAIDLMLVAGQSASVANPDRFRRYRVRTNWVIQYLKANVVHQFGAATVEVTSANLLFLGNLGVDAEAVPVYLARRLKHERSYAETDTALRSRSNLGIGLVVNAGHRAGFSIAANVLVSLSDHLAEPSVEETESPAIDLESLRAAFRRHRNLAQGGETVELELTGEHAGILRVPGKGTIGIEGENRLRVVGRLVAAHKKAGGSMKTADMIAGIEDQSLSNIFGAELWKKLKSGFLRSPKKGLWQIAA